MFKKPKNTHRHISKPLRCNALGKCIAPITQALNGEARGQALVLLAVSFFALLAFIGLVTDVGSIYVSYTQLQRAVDAAAVAAANNIKYPQATYTERKQKITESAREMLKMHDVTGVSDLVVYLCGDTGAPAAFNAMCPQPGQPPRKLAWVQATQQSPVFFLQIFGLHAFPLTTSAVGEAAAVDLVLVFDTSESMGVNTPGYDPNNFNPSTCNAANDCQPLRNAKDAAKSLLYNLFDGYDQVSIVTFNYDAHVEFNLSSDLGDDDGANDGDAFAAIDYRINLHDDAPAALLPWTRTSPPATGGGYRTFNPIFPDDRDGDGQDGDGGLPPCTDAVNNTTGAPTPDVWDDFTGEPCDQDNILDAFDWNADGLHDAADDAIARDGTHNPFTHNFETTSLVSTCSGCGIRTATEVLAGNGRPTAVWVMVFLSDGVANMSDTHLTWTLIPSSFRYGFCGEDPTLAFWGSNCIDYNDGNTPSGNPDPSAVVSAGRYCIDNDPDECPPGSTPTDTAGPYSVEDYAFDMVDSAALLQSSNPNEPRGEDIIVYSIGLGAARLGENLLRYMANVGDDGTRLNDPCTSVAPLSHCGNYYYAPNTSYLAQIFENIANRIFTKISR